MSEYILFHFHHGGVFVEAPVAKYLGESESTECVPCIYGPTGLKNGKVNLAKSMPLIPKKCMRRAKAEPRKGFGKLSKKGVKMTCSKCYQLSHNKFACKFEPSMRDTTQASNPTQRSQPTQKRQPTTNATTMPSVPSSICEDISAVRRSGHSQSTTRGRGRGLGLGRGYFRSVAAAIGGRDTSNISSNLQQAHETHQTAGYKRPRLIGFGIYEDTMTGKSILNLGSPSERVIARV